ncbi:mannuronan epimerase [Enemella evansiae]|uniref:Mannuronan epimerase n=1 Tax=Enemella evansiae TaxID=2016499 RepID=A0A255FYG7_9ACTN|nr:glycosyl hydrolase family 28-related protein [Enemella evansiae]OYO08695.1 mannuronan epimerase [Enemella evansiae]
MNEPSRPDRVDRRWVLGGAAGAALVGLAACSRTPVPPQLPEVMPGGPRIDVRTVGAVGDGQADDTKAFATALEQAGEERAVYIPTGTYRLTGLPDITRYTTILGDGPDKSLLIHQGEGPLFNLAGTNRASFRSFGVHLVHPSGMGMRLRGAFMCGFDDVILRGDHQGANFPQYAGQVGVELIENSGANTFTNCFFTNLGVGLRTACIQNYVAGCRFLTNRVGVLGVRNGANAGLSIVDSEFTSDTHPETTDAHLLVEGIANVWWLTNLWFEGCDTAVRVGDANGGPAQFGLVNCKLAARRVVLDLRRCGQAYLASVALDPDAGSSPAPLAIDPRGCPTGTAEELIVDQRRPVEATAFPPGWTVQGGGQRSGGEFLGPLQLRGRPGQPLADHRDAAGTRVGGVLADGSLISDSPTAGVVLRGANGRYYRLVVNAEGQLAPLDLGTDRPS